LQLKVHSEEKVVEIYLTRCEKNEPDVQARLKEIYDQYRRTKYIVAVFESGDGDLYSNTLELLSHNKKVSAEKALCKEKNDNKLAG